ncbi:formyltransferase [Chitinimonas sp.]|uniref:formyltransferase n=1 Tax=Chitinimonas sp. TaxID=1934313 RepID=UPI0035B29346
MHTAVVFAYHNVGVRCLATLLARGVHVALVVTHRDNPSETIWFDSVAELASRHGIAVITPDDPNTPEVIAAVSAAQPDFLFSFYYRHMLKAPLLAIAPRGAYNMHGSLLPQYRGRVPVNWAVLRGETETGATLHVMNEKPDNGAIVDQQAVPILPDDTAHEVFGKVTVAAEQVLWRCLPALLSGTHPLTVQDLSLGGYFGGRKPEDGRLDWSWPARRIHDFVRALSKPYPGAFADIGSKRLVVWRTWRLPDTAPIAASHLAVQDGMLVLHCADGSRLRVLEAELDGAMLDAETFARHFGATHLALS